MTHRVTTTIRVTLAAGLLLLPTFVRASEMPAPKAAPVAAPKPAETADPQSNPAYLIEIAQVNLRYGVMDQVEPLLKKAMEKATPAQKLQAIQILADVAARKNDFAGAAKQMEEAVAGLPEGTLRMNAALRLAEFYQQAKNNDAAEKVLVDLSKQLANNTQNTDKWLAQEVQRRLLQLWANTPGKLESVLKESEAAIAANPKDEAALNRLAEVYAGFKPDAAKAVDVLEKLSALHPDNADLKTRLAAAYRQNKQFDKAIELFKQQMGGKSKFQVRQAAFEIGQAYLQSGKKDEAVSWMKENFDKPDATNDDLNMLSGFYLIAQMPEASEDVLAKALIISRTPDEKASILLRLANSAVRRKDTAKAQTLLETLEKDFADKPYVQAQAKMLRSRLQALTAQPKPPVAQPIQQTPAQPAVQPSAPPEPSK